MFDLRLAHRRLISFMGRFYALISLSVSPLIPFISSYAQDPLAQANFSAPQKQAGARKLFEERVKENPADYLSATMLAQIYCTQARELATPISYEMAEKLLRKALETSPDYTSAKRQLVQALLGLHKFAEAVTIARTLQVGLKEPDNSTVALEDALFEMGEYQEAEKELDRLLKAFPEEPAILVRKAKLLEVHGKNTEALKTFQLASKLSSERDTDKRVISWYLIQEGERYLKIGKIDDARKLYDEALKLDPTYEVTIEHLAEVDAAKGNLEAAKKGFLKALEISKRPELLQALGDLETLQGNTTAAEPYFNEAKKVYEEPIARGEIYYLHHLAHFYTDSQLDSKRAVELARKDLDVRHSWGAYEGLAWALFKDGQYTEAQKWVEKALAIGIEEAHLFSHASMIYGSVGDFAKSKSFLGKAEKLNPLYNVFHIHR